MALAGVGRHGIARRAALEVRRGQIVNLGIGIPTLVAQYIPAARRAIIHCENGIMDMGPPATTGAEDPNIIDAGGLPVTAGPLCSYTDSALAFAVVRSGRVDLAILGALEVSVHGHLANWIVPGERIPGIGGALDLAEKARRLVVVCEHFHKSGLPKVVSECSLPLTSRRTADLIITDLAVMTVAAGGLVVTEVAAGVDTAELLAAMPSQVRLAPGWRSGFRTESALPEPERH